MGTARTASASHPAKSRGEKPPPVRSVMQPVADQIAHAPADAADEPFQRDSEYLARWLPWFARYSSYFSSEVRGLENLPADGPALVVGNHSGH